MSLIWAALIFTGRHVRWRHPRLSRRSSSDRVAHQDEPESLYRGGESQ